MNIKKIILSLLLLVLIFESCSFSNEEKSSASNQIENHIFHFNWVGFTSKLQDENELEKIDALVETIKNKRPKHIYIMSIDYQPESYSISTGRIRAEFIKDYLIFKKIDPKKIETLGFYSEKKENTTQVTIIW